MPVTGQVTQALIVSGSCRRALLVTGTVTRGHFTLTRYSRTLDLTDSDVVEYVSALVHNTQVAHVDADTIEFISGLVKNGSLLLVDADAVAFNSGVVLNSEVSLAEADTVAFASRVIVNSQLAFTDQDTIDFQSGLVGEQTLELQDMDTVEFQSGKVYNVTLTVTDDDSLVVASQVVHNSALLLTDQDTFATEGGLIYNSAPIFEDQDSLALDGGKVHNSALVVVDFDSVVFSSEVVDGGGGSNPYYDAIADFYYELSDESEASGGDPLTNVNSVPFITGGLYGNFARLPGSVQGDAVHTHFRSDAIGAAMLANGHIFSVEFYYRLPTGKTVNDIAVTEAASYGPYLGSFGHFYHSLSILYHSGKNRFRIRRGSASTIQSVGDAGLILDDGDWHKFTWQVGHNAGAGHRLYVDDVLVCNEDSSSNTPSNTIFGLGTDISNGNDWPGDYEELKIHLSIP